MSKLEPKLRLSREQVACLYAYCVERRLEKFNIEKIDGKGVSAGAEGLRYYFPGCNPATDSGCRRNARELFGDLDFIVPFDVALLSQYVILDPGVKAVQFVAVGTRFELSIIV